METLQIVFVVVGILICAVIFFLIGMFYRKKVAEREITSAEEEAKRIINDSIKSAENKKREMMLEAKEEIHKSRTEYEKEVKERRSDLQKQEHRLQQKEESLDRKLENYEQREEELSRKHAALAATQEEVTAIKRSQLEMLEKISGLTQDDAKNYLLQNVESEIRHETAMKIKEIQTELKDEADQYAKDYCDGHSALRCLSRRRDLRLCGFPAL